MKNIKIKKLLAIALVYGLSFNTLISANALKPFALSRSYSSGAGTEINPYLISTPEDLNQLRLDLLDGVDTTNKYYKLTNNIDLKDFDTDKDTSNGNWTPLGTNNFQFKGILDGSGFSISNVIINLPSENNIGFIGYMAKEGIVKNLNLKNLDIDASYSIGGLVNTSYGLISNSSVQGEITALTTGYIGGIVEKNNGTVENSYVDVNLTATTTGVGGIVETNRGLLENSYSKGIIKASGYAGGLVQSNGVGTIKHSVSYAKIDAPIKSGGVMAQFGGEIVECYWDEESSGKLSYYGANGVTGLQSILSFKTSEMQGENAKTNMRWLDFNNVWTVVQGDYPILKSQIKSYAIKPTVNKLEDGRIELIDNNPENERAELYYRINNPLTKSNDWILYTSPFMPEYDVNGEFNLEVKSINASGLESQIELFYEKKESSVSVNKDLSVNILSNVSLEMSLSTNEIIFENYNGTKDFENNDLVVTVSSGLAYDLNATLVKDLTDETDETNKIPSNLLGIKTSSDLDYQFFTQEGDKKALISNAQSGDNISHNIDINLKGNSSIKQANYQGTIGFEVTQK